MLVSYNVLIHNTMFQDRILYFTDWSYDKMHKVRFTSTSFSGSVDLVLAGSGPEEVGDGPGGLILEGQSVQQCVVCI